MDRLVNSETQAGQGFRLDGDSTLPVQNHYGKEIEAGGRRRRATPVRFPSVSSDSTDSTTVFIGVWGFSSSESDRRETACLLPLNVSRAHARVWGPTLGWLRERFHGVVAPANDLLARLTNVPRCSCASSYGKNLQHHLLASVNLVFRLFQMRRQRPAARIDLGHGVDLLEGVQLTVRTEGGKVLPAIEHRARPRPGRRWRRDLVEWQRGLLLEAPEPLPQDPAQAIALGVRPVIGHPEGTHDRDRGAGQSSEQRGQVWPRRGRSDPDARHEADDRTHHVQRHDRCVLRKLPEHCRLLWSPTAMVRVRAHLNQCRRRHPLTPAPRRT